MDTVTQIALGAAIGELVLGRKVGWRAAVVGGLCGTMPDLDVFVPLGDPVSDFTYHRGVSHSLFVLALSAPVIAEIIVRVQKEGKTNRWGWHALVFLVLLTHPLLDSFTVYGTQIFWPFDTTPVGWATIFIIDPAYTLPLIVGLICALIMGRKTPTGHRLNTLGVVLSTVYLGWTVLAKQQASAAAETAFARAGIQEARIIPIAGPFTSLFWRIVAVDDTTYYNAYYSILDDEAEELRYTPHSRNIDLLKGLEDDWATRRLQWFTKGFYALKRDGDAIILTDLRMGFEPNYVFSFKLASVGNPHAVPLDKPEHIVVEQDVSGLSWVWQRIWSSEVPLRP